MKLNARDGSTGDVLAGRHCGLGGTGGGGGQGGVGGTGGGGGGGGDGAPSV